MTADAVRIMDEEYQSQIARGESRLSAAKRKARQMWDSESEVLIALDDYTITADDIKSLVQLRRLAMSCQHYSPAILQQAVMTALDGMNERVIEFAFDSID